MSDASTERLRELVWQWIIDHHENSYDSGDLIQSLEESGFPCPADLENEVPR